MSEDTDMDGNATGALCAVATTMLGGIAEGTPHLIEKDGERQYKFSLIGYEDWTIIASGEVAKPIDDAEWTGTGWEIPIEKLRRWKRDEVNTVRQRYQDGGCVVPDVGKVDSDEKAKTNISGSVQLADRALAKAARDGVPCEWETGWTMHADNPVPVVTLDAEAMGVVGEAVGYHVGKCHAVGRDIKAMIEAAADAAALDAIDIEAIYAGAFA